MQEKIEVQPNPYFLPQILSFEEQKQRLRCPNHNQAISVCISKDCSIPGLMCLQTKCQCRRIHLKCHHILVDRVLESIERHQKQIPQKVKETYKTIYEMINQLIDKLSDLRTKFEKEEQYFGLREEELQFIELINDQKIDEVNGKIISSLEKTFDVQIELNKNSKEDIIKDFQLKRKQFDKLIKSIEKNYLQTQETHLLSLNILKDSKIILKQEQKQMMNEWLLQSFKQKQNLESQLLFRASQNNFSVQQFHNKCDGKRDTLVIVKNQFDKIIGGFTSQPWNTSNRYIKDENNKAFMFSINLKQKYKCNNSSVSIQGYKDYGPTFGNGHQLVLYDKCNQNDGSNSHFGKSYNLIENNKIKYQFDTRQTNALFTGNPNGNHFKVVQYEVYQIK